MDSLSSKAEVLEDSSLSFLGDAAAHSSPMSSQQTLPDVMLDPPLDCSPAGLLTGDATVTTSPDQLIRAPTLDTIHPAAVSESLADTLPVIAATIMPEHCVLVASAVDVAITTDTTAETSLAVQLQGSAAPMDAAPTVTFMNEASSVTQPVQSTSPSILQGYVRLRPLFLASSFVGNVFDAECCIASPTRSQA